MGLDTGHFAACPRSVFHKEMHSANSGRGVPRGLLSTVRHIKPKETETSKLSICQSVEAFGAWMNAIIEHPRIDKRRVVYRRHCCHQLKYPRACGQGGWASSDSLQERATNRG